MHGTEDGTGCGIEDGAGNHDADTGTGKTFRLTEGLSREAASGPLFAQLAELRQEHRDLDAAITALVQSGMRDQLQIQRLKKKKLMLKDKIRHIEEEAIPNIIA